MARNFSATRFNRLLSLLFGATFPLMLVIISVMIAPNGFTGMTWRAGLIFGVMVLLSKVFRK